MRKGLLAFFGIISILLFIFVAFRVLTYKPPSPRQQRPFVDYGSYSAAAAAAKSRRKDWKKERIYVSHSEVSSRKNAALVAAMHHTKNAFASGMEEVMKDYKPPYDAEALERGMENMAYSQEARDLYNEIETLYNIYNQDLAVGKAYYESGSYSRAISSVERALDHIQDKDLKHKIEAYEILAMASLKMKRYDDYKKYMILKVRTQRNLDKFFSRAYPKTVSMAFSGDWFSPQEAMKNLMNIKKIAAGNSSSAMMDMLAKAESDYEIARSLAN